MTEDAAAAPPPERTSVSADMPAPADTAAPAPVPDAPAPVLPDAPAPARPRVTSRIATVLRVSALVVDLLIQALLIWVGFVIVLADDDDIIIAALVGWCLLGTGYWLLTVIVVSLVARGGLRANAAITRVELNPVSRFVTTFATFLASFIGVVAATELIALRDEPEWQGWIEFVAVWAMLLSWALFHWGFARIYSRRYYRAAEPALRFPDTASPGIVDFVYFAFTNATAFSVSDVEVLTSRMRWTVVWHTTVSFFLNALIIVLAVNTIMG